MKEDSRMIKAIRMIKISAVITLMLMLLTSCEGGTVRDTEEKEYVFFIGSERISVGADLDDAVGRLGEPNYFRKNLSCASDGFDELYVYDGFRIIGMRIGTACSITKIEITSDIYKTAEKVGIGDKRELVREVYGDGISVSEQAVEYVGVSCKLQFHFRDDRVVSVKYVEK